MTRSRAPALLAAVICGLLGALVSVIAPVAFGGSVAAGPARPARAGDPGPYASSSATRYQVTFAARSCGSYKNVVAGQARDDAGETLGRPGRDSPYQPGQAVEAGVEDGVDAGCTDLPGWRFTLGSGHEHKGRLSTVTGRLFTTPATKDSTSRLDATGKDAGGLLAGAVTVSLTDEQVGLAARRQLWVQGGTPDKPVGDGYAFGALRCAVDGRTAGNLQWLSFPSGVRHVFCYAYYVKGAGAGGTVTVRMRTTRPVGYPQRVPFTSGLSNAADGGFVLASSGEQVEATFVREASATPYQVRPSTPAGWRMAATCAASRPDGRPAKSTSTVDATTGTASVTLATGDVVVCTYSMDPPAQPPGLRLSLVTPGAGGTFGLALAGGARQQALTATTGGDGGPVTASGADLAALASGRYTVTVTPPAAQAAQWALRGALCNGAPATVNAMTVAVDLVPGVPLECVLRLDRKPPALRLEVVTASGIASAAFAVVPADGADAGWWAAANTTGYGVPAAATGDVPRDLPFGTYLISAIPPRSTLTTGWRLNTLRCDEGKEATAGGAVRARITPGGPEPVCTASYQAEPTTRLRVTLQAKGARSGRQGPAVVEVSCVDGSGGRLVLGPAVEEQAALPEPLAFLEPTDCVVSQPATGAARTSLVKTSATREPSTGGGALELPSELDVARDVTEYTMAVTNEFGEPLAISSRASFLDKLRALPMILASIGMFGFGGLIFLGVFLRRRPT